MRDKKPNKTKNQILLKMHFGFFAILSFIIFAPKMVFADSSWVWLTDYRPFDILPPVAIATIIIETLAIWLIPQTGKFFKTLLIILFANAASFLLPYVIIAGDSFKPFNEMLNSGPFYIVGFGFLFMTILIEVPTVFTLLKKHVKNEKKLLWTIIGSNIVTTIMVGIIEHLITKGHW